VEKIPAPSLAGNLFGDSTQQPVAIYFPPSYGTSKLRYPVVYFLPGFGDGIAPYLDGTYQGFRLQNIMDSLIRVGVVKEMIVVVINGRNYLGGSFYTNSPATGNWEDFVVKDVVTYIDSRYRTILRPRARGIAGHSMGGYGALSLAMRYPDLFGSAYAMSPGLFAESGLEETLMFAERQTIDNYLALERGLASLDREQATVVFGKIIDSLTASQDWSAIFTLAYGAAFSSRPGKNCPHISYPYSLRNDSLVMDTLVWKRWESGFGDLAAKVKGNRVNLQKLTALAIEYGATDEATWIPKGCRYLSQALEKEGIPFQTVAFEGGHQDKLGERLAQYMLPFFTEYLLFQKSK
jgi:enterochelin esterase-like enzyme